MPLRPSGYPFNMAERDAAIAYVLPGTHTIHVGCRWGGIVTSGMVSDRVPVRLEVAADGLKA
jgi:hypothetical protein